MCILLVICIISAPGCLLIGHDLPDQRSARAIEHHKSALFSFPRLFLIPSHDVLPYVDMRTANLFSLLSQ